MDSILNTNAVRAVATGYTVEGSSEADQTFILNLIESQYRVKYNRLCMQVASYFSFSVQRLLQGVSLDLSNITTNVSFQLTPSCPPE